MKIQVAKWGTPKKLLLIFFNSQKKLKIVSNIFKNIFQSFQIFFS